MKKMKAYICLLLALLMALSLIACGGNSSDASSPSTPIEGNTGTEINPIHLTASTGLPGVMYYNEWYFQPLLEYVNEATGGAVTYDIFTDGELVPLTAEYDGIRQGQIDIALSLTAMYDPGRFPLCSSVAMLPVISATPRQCSMASLAMFQSDRLLDGKTYYDREFTDNGIVGWISPAFGGQYFAMRKGLSINNISDFTGLRMRSSATSVELTLKALGSVPVSMSAMDIYDALSRGALDGIVFPPDWESYGMGELLGDVIDANMGVASTTSWVSVTQETWDSWPEEVQNAFNEGFEKCYVEAIEGTELTAQKNRDAVTNNGGRLLTIADLPEDVQDFISECYASTWYAWIDETEANGHPGKETAILWRDCMVDAGIEVPEAIMDLEDYTPNA